MSVPAPSPRLRPARLPDLRRVVEARAEGLALAGCAVIVALAWTVVALAGPLEIERIDSGVSKAVAYAVPAVLCLALLLYRGAIPPWASGVVAWTAAVGLGVLSLDVTENQPVLGFAPLGLAALAVGVRTNPVAAFTFVLVAAGFQFSIKAEIGIPLAPVGDAVLAAAWFALLWDWATGARPLPRRVPLSLVLLGIYVGLSAVSALVQENTNQSFYSFRLSCWYMSAALLVAMFADKAALRAVLRRVVLTTILLVGAYAVVRWLIGPGAAEEAAVRAGGAYVLDDLSNVRLFGSLPGPTALAVWCGLVGPIGLAFLLTPLPTWERVGGGVAVVLTAVAVGPTEIRSGLVAMAAGMLLVLAVFACSGAFRGHRSVPLLLVLALLIPGTIGFVAVQLAGGGSRAERFRGLVDPLNDKSVQDRLVKWQTVLSDVRGKPFGNGLGASGGAEARYARFTTSATFNPDSGYVKAIYDQGYLVTVVYLAAILALLAAVIRQATRAGPTGDAAMALAASGALASFAIVLNAGPYQEGMATLILWTTCGLALAPLMSRELEPSA